MRRRSNLLVLLGVAFFLVGGVAVYILTSDEDSGADERPPITVVVGREDIPAGSLGDDLIASEAFREVEIAPEEVTPGAIRSINQLEGATFVQGFAAEQQITGSGLQLQNRTYEIPEGYEAVAVELDFPDGVAGYVNPGDRINLFGVYNRELGDPNRLAPRAELLLTNVEVLDVDLSIAARRGTAAGDPSAEAPQRSSSGSVTFLLALRTVDVEKVVFSTEFHSLYASLVPKDAPPAGHTPGQDGQSVLGQEAADAFAAAAA